MITEKLNLCSALSPRTMIISSCLIMGLTAFSTAKATSHQQSDLLTDNNQMTLYTFDKDGQEESNCYQQCASNWPPYLADNSDNKSNQFSKITRKDGAQQWAYKGSPLYYWKFDNKPGDATGNGVGGVWHVVNLKSSSFQNSRSNGYSYRDY